MLEFLRKGIKSWVAKILLALLIASFAVWGIGDIFVGASASKVGEVGETEISAQRFGNAIMRQQEMMSRQRQQLVSIADLRAAGVGEQVLANLVRDAVFAEELNGLGIAVPAESVAEAIRSNPSFQDGQGGFSQYLYQTTLAQQRFDPREFEALTRELLGQQIIGDAVVQGSTLPPGLATAIANWRGETRTVATVSLTTSLAADPGTPDDAALTAYFEENREAFREPERRWGEFLHIDPARLAAGLAPTDDEVRAQYDATIDEYSQKATRTVEQIVFPDRAAAEAAATRIASDEATWEEIAAEQNLSLESLSLGTVSEGELPPDSSDAVFALTETGITDPVEVLDGVALLNVIELTQAGTTPFESVRDTIARRMARDAARAAATEAANRIDDLRAGGATMAEISKEADIPLVKFDGLAADGSVTDGAVPAVATDPRFLAEVQDAVDGEERDITELSDRGYVLVMIDEIVDSHLPELDAVRARVIEAWQHEERLLALEERAASLIGGGDLETIAAETETEVENLPAFARLAPPPLLSGPLTEAVFDAEQGDLVVGRSGSGNAVVIAAVSEVTPLSEDALAESVQTIEQSLDAGLARDQIELFSRALEERHGAVVNRDSIEMIYEQLGATRGY